MSALAVIKVRFQMEGRHRWPDAPDHRCYLRNEHRHLFHVTVSTLVEHDDREIEFHDLRDDALAIFRGLAIDGDLGDQSCEMMARKLSAALRKEHGRLFTVEVSEDGEFSAEVTDQAFFAT